MQFKNADRNQLIDDLVGTRNLLTAAETFTNHLCTWELIKDDIYLKDKDWDCETNETFKDAEIRAEIANYHAVLLKALNALDSLAIVITMSTMSDGTNKTYDPKLHEVFWYSITNRTAVLLPFIEKYNDRTRGTK